MGFKRFGDWQIGYRIGLAFALTITLLIAVAGFAGNALQQINHAMASVTKDYYVKVRTLEALTDEANKQARFARNMVIFDDSTARSGEMRSIEKSLESASNLYATLSDLVRTKEGTQMLEKLQNQRVIYRQSLDDYLALIRRGDEASARRHLMDSLRQSQLDYMDTMQNMVRYQEEQMNIATQAADDLVTSNIWTVIALGLSAAAAAVVLGWWITRSITQPIAHAVEIAEAVAAGNLTSSVPEGRGDEVGQLLSALGHMNDGLTQIVHDVRNASDSIATGSVQIAQGNIDLSQRTEEQASNLEETAASMEQLTATVQQNADAARQAHTLARSASEAATTGGQVVRQVVATMNDIKQSSSQMAEIIAVIDGIAFQTNILALNAAVEAARAGAQGRGFAVVASEVRTLAQRSAEAAREIKTLIEGSVSRVQDGGLLVDTAGRSMNDIVDRVAEVLSLMTEISAASTEQSSGINQVSDAIQQLDQVTQQNAALVEESAAAASSLKSQAEGLSRVVAQFRLTSDTGGVTPAALTHSARTQALLHNARSPA